ncbi:M12 family metallo-peptidase [Methylomagnum sp.]
MKLNYSNTHQNSLAISLLAGLLLSLMGLGEAMAMPITKALTVNVVTVCADNGSTCASQGPAGDLFFAAEVNKIWAQAGIHFDFVLQPNLNNSNFLVINDSNVGHRFADLSAPSATSVTMWLTHYVTGAYGEGWLGAGGLVIAMQTVMDAMRLDTIAHELGHNLGLNHDDTNYSFLMASGGVRNTPNSLANIAPDGLGYDLLSPTQIAIAQQSGLLHDVASVPEPASLAVFALGLLAFASARGRQALVRAD